VALSRRVADGLVRMSASHAKISGVKAYSSRRTTSFVLVHVWLSSSVNGWDNYMAAVAWDSIIGMDEVISAGHQESDIPPALI